jgi:AraC-like DNA-binding protein
MMAGWSHVPRAPLSDFVELFWLYDGTAPKHAGERLLPTGGSELVIDLKYGRASFFGARSESYVLDGARMEQVLGVHFKTGGAFPFFGVPAGELHNEDVPLETLWRGRAGEFCEALAAAPTPAAKFAIVERTLRDMASTFARSPAVKFGIETLRHVPLTHSVTQLAESTGLTQRSFIARFRDEVGLTPKLFSRVRRFHEVIRRVHAVREPEWTHVALACGYFDQAHFINDFRTFSGLTPTQYLARRTPRLNHLAM